MTQPPSRRIADRIGEAILRGEHAAGEKMPSERVLAQRWNVTRATVAHALQILRDRGLIESRHGSGSYVRSSAPESALPDWRRPIVVVEVRTHHPEDYELINHLDGTHWVIVDGHWKWKPVPD